MPFVILPTNSASGGYEITNSLRFNDDSSDYLDKSSYGTPTSTKIFTWSSWIKLGEVGARGRIFDFYSAPFSYGNGLFFTVGHQLGIGSGDSNNGRIITNRVFRDPSAWYHIVAVQDTTNATASDRLKLYVNGVRETSFSASVDAILNADYQAFRSNVGGIGTYYDKSTSSEFFDGYMSDVYFIDGQALTPSSFGETDEDTGIWKPKAYTGTYGTNGFYLQFKNSGSLGTDSSGNGNTFTVNNLTSIDQTTDTPTNNFCTWNAISAPYSAPTLSEGNTKVTNNSANWQGAIGTIGVSQGKWYWEGRFDSTTFSYNHGVIDESVNFSAINPMNATGYTGFYNYDGGEMKKDATDTTANYGTFGTNDIIGIALNMDSKQISIYKNGTIHVSNFALSTTSTLVFPCTVYYSGGVCSYNFGNPSYSANSYQDANGFGNFSYSVPSGYYALCTKNLYQYGF